MPMPKTSKKPVALLAPHPARSTIAGLRDCLQKIGTIGQQIAKHNERVEHLTERIESHRDDGNVAGLVKARVELEEVLPSRGAAIARAYEEAVNELRARLAASATSVERAGRFLATQLAVQIAEAIRPFCDSDREASLLPERFTRVATLRSAAKGIFGEFGSADAAEREPADVAEAVIQFLESAIKDGWPGSGDGQN